MQYSISVGGGGPTMDLRPHFLLLKFIVGINFLSEKARFECNSDLTKQEI